jgi:hypothetical protein
MPRAIERLPTDEDLLGILRRRGSLTMRALCVEIWPHLRWRPLFSIEDSAADGILANGRPRALYVWERLGDLVRLGRVRVTGRDPDEVDDLAAVTFEVLGQRLWM